MNDWCVARGRGYENHCETICVRVRFCACACTCRLLVERFSVFFGRFGKRLCKCGVCFRQLGKCLNKRLCGSCQHT